MRFQCLLAAWMLPSLLLLAGSISGFVVPSSFRRRHGPSVALSSSQQQKQDTARSNKNQDEFIFRQFATECDDSNLPRPLKIVANNIQTLTSQGSDIRGRVVDHARLGRISQAAQAIESSKGIPALTPFVAYCLGHAFAYSILQEDANKDKETITIALGRDPRSHGVMLCDAFARGVASASASIRVVYTGVATTPSMFHFCRSGLCDGAVMVTASHLPADRNGFKLFSREKGGFTREHVQGLSPIATQFAQQWHDGRSGLLPPTSGGDGVFCSEWVDFMPQYAESLKAAIQAEVSQQHTSNKKRPLEGLTIVMNSGNGSGGFFQEVLKDLGADVSASMGVEPNGDFPAGIPNPENKEMIAQTIQQCQAVEADLGILLDTDADRSGFVIPAYDKGGVDHYEPLNRNRLIALLAVIFSQSSPGCTIVTDSVTSEGLATFMEQDLGLQHVRYLKGYANVIGKAQELTSSNQANAEVAIETSGHCAMKENGYLDDGTYTAVKVIGLLAREKLENVDKISLLDLIEEMEEMEEVAEIRMEALDGSLETMAKVFDVAANVIEGECSEKSSLPWSLDTDNLEGIRVRIGKGGFFMLRKSLHDPLLSLQVEAESRQEALDKVVTPLLQRFQSIPKVSNYLDTKALEEY